MKPLVSLFCSSIRTERWKSLIYSLKSNKVSFELIFVGNNVPKVKIPKNCHFIYSSVKPAQCSEIAARYTAGELIMPIADDLIFSENALDHMVGKYEQISNDKAIVSNRLFRSNIYYKDDYYRYFNGVDSSPLMPLCGLMSKELWDRLGGIDRRFTALMWHLDIAMRALEIGGEVYFENKSFVEEVFYNGNLFDRLLIKLLKKKQKMGLYQEYGGPIDRPFLDSLWTTKENILNEDVYATSDDGVSILRKRALPFIPFNNQYLLTKSQDPVGRW